MQRLPTELSQLFSDFRVKIRKVLKALLLQNIIRVSIL